MNLPNKLSIARICMVPLFVVAFFLPYDWTPFVALGIFILAAVTDFLDGYIARKYKLVTNLGKLLDPIADKILVCAALFCIAVVNPLRYVIDSTDTIIKGGLQNGHVVFAVCGALILSRELLIDAVRMIAASKGTVVQANVYGKIKTILLDVALPVLMAVEGLARTLDYYLPISFRSQNYQAMETAYKIFSYLAIVLFIGAVIMTVVSGVVYLAQNRKVFAEDKND